MRATHSILAVGAAAVLFLGACSDSGEQGDSTASTSSPAATATPAGATGSPSTTTAPTQAGATTTATKAATTATGKVSANTATQAQVTAALEAAGVSNADRWAREVVEYRPYPANDPNFAKLRQELAKYNPGPGVVDKIISVLEP